MYKAISILALALCLCVGAVTANMGYSIGLTSGATTFADNLNFGPSTFQQNSAVDFSKTNGPSDDPHFGACHGWTDFNGALTGQAIYEMGNGGMQAQSLFDQGSATATMQFQDTGAKMTLLSGTQTGNDVYNAWSSSYFTNYAGMTANQNANWQWQNGQTLNGITLDRTTGVLNLQFYIASPIVTHLTRPVFT